MRASDGTIRERASWRLVIVGKDGKPVPVKAGMEVTFRLL
jgi:hypothetical protein